MYKKLLAFLLVIILLFLSLHLLLRRGLFSEQLTRFAASRIQAVTGTPVTVNRVTLSLVPASAVLDGVVLPFPKGEGEAGRTPITIQQVRISVSPWSLLTEVLFVKKISLIGPQIPLRIGEGPLLPVRLDRGEETDGSTARPQRLRAVIREIEIQNGRLAIQQAGGEPFLTLAEISGTVTPDLRMETFQASLSAKGVTVDGKAYHKKLDSLVAQLTLQSHFLEIRKMELTDAASRFTVSGTIRNPIHPELALTVDASFPLADFETLFPKRYPPSGSAQLLGELAGTWPELTARGNLSVSDLTVASKPVGNLKTVFSYQDQSLSFSELSASVFGGQASGSAQLPLPTGADRKALPPYRLSLAVSKLDPSAFLPILGVDRYPGRQHLDGQVDLEGAGLDPAQLSGNGSLHLVEQNRTPLPENPSSGSAAGPDAKSPSADPIRMFAQLQEVSSRFQMDHGAFLIDTTTFRLPQTSLTVRGSIRLDGPIAMEAALKSRDIAELAALIHPGQIGGSVEVSGRLTGTIKDPAFKGKGQAKDLQLRGRSFETAESDLSYQNRKIQFKKAVFREKQARYEIKGLISFDPTERDGAGPFFDVSAKIHNGSPRDVIAIFTKELPIQVPATGELTARGVPKTFQMTAKLQAGAGLIYGQSVDEGAVTFILTHDRITFKQASARRGETVLSGRGWIRFMGEFEFSAQTSHARLEDFEPFHKQVSGLKSLFSGQISGRGPFQDPHFETQLSLLDLIYLEQPLGTGTFSARTEKHRLTADLRLSRGLAATGELEWKPGYPFQVSLGLSDVDLKPWLGRAAPALSPISLLTTSGTVKASGQIAPAGEGPQAIEASVQLTSLKMGFPDYTVTNDGEIQLALQNGNVTVQSLRLKGPGTSLTLSGGLQLLKSYNLFVSGEADLDLFRIFTKEITYGKGLAYLALQVTDRWEDPKIRGGLTIHEGVLKSESLGQTIKISSLGFSFNERQVLLESLDAEFGGGKLQASGRIDLERFVPARFGLALEMAGARISPVRGLTGTVDASLAFEGDTEKQSLRGEVLIRRATYERRLDWQTWVLELLKEEKEVSRPSPLLKNISLNIHIAGKDNLWINNNLAKLPLEADLILKGTWTRPVLLGRVEAKSGTFTFRRNDFKVQSAVVDFINPERIRPIIDVQAATRVKNYDIDMNLTGPADKFDLALTSNPPLKDENDILCLLTFSKPCKDVAETSKEIGTAEAGALISGGIQNVITDKVEAITGIDRIQIDPYYSSTRPGSGPRITVSKRLLEDKLYVTYATTMDPSQEQLIQLEYTISKNVSLIGQRDELGHRGGDLKLHFEFR